MRGSSTAQHTARFIQHTPTYQVLSFHFFISYYYLDCSRFVLIGACAQLGTPFSHCPYPFPLCSPFPICSKMFHVCLLFFKSLCDCILENLKYLYKNLLYCTQIDYPVLFLFSPLVCPQDLSQRAFSSTLILSHSFFSLVDFALSPTEPAISALPGPANRSENSSHIYRHQVMGPALAA